MFKIHSEYKPTDDQPQVMEYLSKRIEEMLALFLYADKSTKIGLNKTKWTREY